MRYYPRFISFFLILLSSPLAHAQKEVQGRILERVVATVNGETIFLTELQEAEQEARKALKEKGAEENSTSLRVNVLDQLVNTRLIDAEIEKRGLSASDSMIDGAITSVMKQNGFQSLTELRSALRQEGLSFEEYRANLKRQIESSRLIAEVIQPRVHLSSDDVQAEINRTSNSDKEKLSLRVRMIYTEKTKNGRIAIEKAQKRILAGESFADVAKEVSQGPGKSDGGDIGLVTSDTLQPALSKALSSMNAGNNSDIIETESGFYLLRLIEKVKVASEVTDTDREKIENELREKETARYFDAFVRELREKAHIEIML